MPCDCNRHIETDISKKLKQSILSTLSSRGKNGLQEIADNFNCIFRCALDSSREERFKAYKLGGSMNFGFDEEVRSLLIQKLVLYNDATDGQSDLEKSLIAMILMMQMNKSDKWLYCNCKMSSDSHEKVESTSSDSDEEIEDTEGSESDDDYLTPMGNPIVCFSETDINRLIDLWSSTSNDHILMLLAQLFFELSANKLYLTLFLSSNVFVKSCTDPRRYLILLNLMQQILLGYWFCRSIFGIVISKVPDLISIMFKSASYLVNCWRLLNTADMTVEMLWIEKRLIHLTNVCHWHISTRFFHKVDVSVAMEIARFFRCLIYAIVKTRSPTNRYLRELLLEHIINHMDALYPDSRIYVLLQLKYELDDVHEDSVDSSSSKSNNLVRNGELKLQPLSREDAREDLFELPQHVNDALKAFPDADLLHDPEIGFDSILQANRHRISTVEWSNHAIREIRCVYHFIDDKKDDL